MPKFKAKNLLISPDGKHFIFYQNTSMFLMVQVFPHNTMASAQDQQEYLEKYYAWHKLPFASAITSFRRQAFLLAAVRASVPQNSDPLKMHNTLKRLADWYLYSYLIPVANNSAPDLPDTDLIM